MLKGVQLSLLMGEALGLPVPREVAEALTSAQVTISEGSRSGFQLTFGIGRKSVLQTTYLPAGFFDPPRRLILVATVSGTPEVLIDGVITRHEVTTSNEPGQSILTVTGEDISALMDMVDLSGLLRYPGMPAEVRVLLCLAKYAAFGVIPKVIPSVIINITNPLDKMEGHQGTDYQYIRMLADLVGYVFYVEPGPMPGTTFAYWGPEIKFGLPQPALTVNSDAHSNVEAMTFSFEGMAKKLFIYYVQNEQTNVCFPIPLPDITPFNPPLGPKIPLPLRTEFLNTPPSPEEKARRLRLQQLEIAEEQNDATAKQSPAQATLIAAAKAARSADVVQASGQLNVVRYGRTLKARQLVGVRGAGLTYDGFYYVKSVTHNLKRGEYKQSFSLTRNALLPYGNKVPA